MSHHLGTAGNKKPASGEVASRRSALFNALRRGGVLFQSTQLLVPQETLLAMATNIYGILRYKDESDRALAERVAFRVQCDLCQPVAVMLPFTVVVNTN